MAAKIPVTVITGFLGAGKTTLIRHLLTQNNNRKIAVLVNEFGEVGIDGEILKSCQVCDEDEAEQNIVELSNGCLCCTVQEEFYPTMQQLLERPNRLDSIVIETSGLALPKPLVKAFRWHDIRNNATVDSVITIVDAQALAAGTLVGDIEAVEAQRKADPNLDHETPIEELFEDQLACADLILLTKIDLLDPETAQKVQHWLQQQIRPEVKIIPCQTDTINPEILLGFNAAVEEDLANRPSHHDFEEDHEHDDEINSIEWSCDREFEAKPLITQLKKLVATTEIYRIKGFVAVPNKSMRLVLQGVGDRFDTFFDRPWQPQETRQTRLVFIGRNLKKADIEAALGLGS